MSDENTVSELTEDMELVGPGSMLAEARKNMGLTQKQVAEKLNFRETLVKDIDADNFDKTLPETFNRGYLRNYAKLVDIDVSEVLASYEMLYVAEEQEAEMLSFSKSTEKHAENKRIMWITYLMLAALISSTVVWWMQDTSGNNVSINSVKPKVVINQPSKSDVAKNDAVTIEPLALETNASPSFSSQKTQKMTVTEQAMSDSASPDLAIEDDFLSDKENLAAEEETNLALQEENETETTPKVTTPPVDVTFTFVGDCWVDIYDANGEHIAWGIKKADYVMNISAVPPISITLGKPELVNITFAGKDVDMNQYSKGNIAKFTLPLAQ